MDFLTIRKRNDGKRTSGFARCGFAAAMALCTGAAAQTDERDADDSDEWIDEIVLTGSRIAGAPLASPVVSITRADIEARGLRSVEDVLRYVPQNFSGITSGGRADGRSPGFDGGVVTVNLRGLGEGSTLVLVNGKRIAASPATAGTFTDVSTIPFSAIERVEILTDGASAIYGSDAVGGVINFILRQEYRGLQPRVRYENSSSGGDSVTLETTGGMSWGSGNLTGSLSFEQADPANFFEAGMPTDGDFSARGGRVVRAFYTQQGSPATRIANGVFDLTPESEIFSAYVDLRQEITDSLDLTLSGLFSDRESKSRDLYQLLQIFVPATNYYSNLLGRPESFRSYAFFNEIDSGALQRPYSIGESRRLGGSATLDWQLPAADWALSLAFGISENEFNTFSREITEIERATIDAVNSSDRRTALNLWGDGSVQRANLNALRTELSQGSRTAKQDFLRLGWRGTALALPAGDVKFYVGAERRNDSTDFTTFTLNPLRSVVSRVPALDIFVPKVKNQAFAAEFTVPILAGKAFAHELSLSIAGRYDEYDVVGPFEGATEPFTSRAFDDFVPKYGLVWYPTAAFKFRATWGEAFQAPTLVELFRPPFVLPYFFPIFDPFDPVSPAIPRFVNSAAGGNADLKPQVSTTTTVGFDYASQLIEGLTVSLTWNETEFENVISSLSAAYGFPDARPALLVGASFPGAVVRDANGLLIQYSPFRPINLASRTSESLDFSVQYGFDTAPGRFELGVQGTRQLGLELVAGPGTGVIETRATQNAPSEWKVNAFADWNKGPWTANLGINYESGHTLINVQAVSREVGSYTSVDARAGHRTDGGWHFALGVNNLFDRDFPFVDNRFGVDSSRVNFRRRIVYFDVTRDFEL